MRLVKVKRRQEEKTSIDGKMKIVISVIYVYKVSVEAETEESEQEILEIWNVTEVWNLKKEDD